MSIFNNENKRKKIKELDKEVIDMQCEVEKLKLQRDTIKQQVELEKEKQEHTFRLKEQKFEADKINWQADMKALENRLRTESETKLTEAISLGKLDKEQELAKQRYEYDKKIQDIQSKHVQDFSQLESKLAKEYYDKLYEAMERFNREGTVTTNFMSDLVKNVFDKIPPARMEAKFISKDEK
jgi:hypothetical protein